MWQRVWHVTRNVRKSKNTGPERSLSHQQDVAYNINLLPNETKMPTNTPQGRQWKDQAFYMQEFVSCVDHLLHALLSREELPDGMCGKCNDQLSRWRCKECFLAAPLCRSCMQHTHMDQPFHKIEQWTGTFFFFFQNANLWQVGTYIWLSHEDCTLPHLFCQNPPESAGVRWTEIWQNFLKMVMWHIGPKEWIFEEGKQVIVIPSGKKVAIAAITSIHL